MGLLLFPHALHASMLFGPRRVNKGPQAQTRQECKDAGESDGGSSVMSVNRLTTAINRGNHRTPNSTKIFDFVVEYKPGVLNVVADTLSRRNEAESAISALSAPQFSLFNDIRQEINRDDSLSQLRDAIRRGAQAAPWVVVDDLIIFKGRVYVAASSQ